MIEPEREDYGPPVGVIWTAAISMPDGVVHKISSTTKEGAQKLIDRIIAGDLPGDV